MRYHSFTKTLLAAFSVFVCLGLASPISATTISLPELAGGLEMEPSTGPDFGYPGQRECDFVIPANVAEIEDMIFVLSGRWNAGEVSCNTGFEDPEISPVLPPISIMITSDAFPGDYFISSIFMLDESFENLTGAFTSSYPPGVLEFGDLLGANLHAELIIDWATLGVCYMAVDSYGTLDEVQLQLIGAVPTETSSWGEVKSLYR